MKRIAWTLVIVLCTFIVHGQNVESIAKSKWISASGGLSIQANTYNSSDSISRQDPFFWSINGNFTASVKTISIPFSFSLNQRQSSYQLPFNQLRSDHQFGLSPQYKNLTLHGGYRNMNFSPYTLAGQMFLGGGIEWHNTNRTWAVKSFGGQFARADLSGSNFSLPFDRYGYGMQVGTTGQTEIGITYLKFWDEPAAVVDSLSTPQTNEVLGIKVVKAIGERVNVSADINASQIMDANALHLSAESPLVSPKNQRKSSFSAVNLKIERAGNKVNSGIEYRRIDPNYSTFGAPYVNNDMEDLTLQLNSSFFRNRVSLGASAGAQRNNLNNQLIGTQLRTIGSLNVSTRIANQVNYNFSISNYTINPSRVQLYELDSMQLYQVTSSANQSIAYVKQGKQWNHSTTAMHSYQASNTQTSKTSLNNYSVAYSCSHKKSATQVTIAGMYFNGTMAGTRSTGYGPNLGLSNSLFKKKLVLQLNASYQIKTLIVEDEALLFAGSAIYQIKKQSFRMTVNQLSRNSATGSSRELRGNFSYSVRF